MAVSVCAAACRRFAPGSAIFRRIQPVSHVALRKLATVENPFAAPPPPPLRPAAPVAAATVSKAAAPPPLPRAVSPPNVPVASAATAKVSKPTRPSSKKTRDPERPKRPLSPYFRFLANYRKENPDSKSKAVTEAASKWKIATSTEKRRYEEPYEVEKKQYVAKWDKYVASGKRDAWKRDPERPKKQQTAFFAFAADFRKKNVSLKLTEAAKQAGAAWKKLAPAQKAPYEATSAANKAKYEKAMEQYKSSGKEEAWQKKVGLTAKAGAKPKSSEKQKRPASAYLRFASEYRTRNPNLAGREGIKQAGAAWKQLSTEQKLPYEAAYAADKLAVEKKKGASEQKTATAAKVASQK